MRFIWRYKSNNLQGDEVANWFSLNNLEVLFSSKDNPTFHSAQWQTGTNPDLTVITSSLSNHADRKVLSGFPHSQHKPIVTSIGIHVNLFQSCEKPRWNFQKANWEVFTEHLDHVIQFLPVSIKNYSRFINLLKSVARKHIPRGYRKKYVPGWNDRCNQLYHEFCVSNNSSCATELLDELNDSRHLKWKKQITGIDFTHSSRKAWSVLRKLGSSGQKRSPKASVKSNQIASRLISNSKVPVGKKRSRQVCKDYREKVRSMENDANYSSDWTLNELNIAISSLKLDKAPGYDGMFAEFLKHLGDKASKWLLDLFNLILKTCHLPNLFKKAKIITVLKPGKDGSDPAHYRPISLLSIVYKLFERLILNRLEPYIDESLPVEQAAFRKNRGCSEQVLALSTFIENGFQKKLKRKQL